MPETAIAQNATPDTQADPKTTAANIAKGVMDKANPKPVEGGKANVVTPDADPNAGKKKYTVNGREVWLTPGQVDAYAQKGMAFEPKMSELARMQQEIAAFHKALVENPGAIMMALAKKQNIPVETMVERVLGSAGTSEEAKKVVGKWYYDNEVRLAQMDPRDRQILEKDEKIRQLEAVEKQKQELVLLSENRERINRALVDTKAQISEVLKDLGLTNLDTPAAARIAREVADVMRLSYFRNEPVTAKQAVLKIKERISSYQKQFFDDLDGDALIEAIGKDNAEKVRKHFLKLVKEQQGGAEIKPATKPVFRRDDRKTINTDDFRDYLDEIKRTGSVPGKK